MSFSENLRAARERRGLTQQQVADLMGMILSYFMVLFIFIFLLFGCILSIFNALKMDLHRILLRLCYE